MVEFPLHQPETAPEEAQAALASMKKKYGMVPNLFSGLAESPPVLEAYLKMSDILGKTTLTPIERNVIFLAASFENGCEFCMAAHTWSSQSAKVPEEEINALRDGHQLSDPKLDALARLTRVMVQERGFVDDKEIEAFLEAGYTKANVLDVLLAVSLKTLSTYSNHILHTPLNEQLSKFEWRKAGV